MGKRITCTDNEIIEASKAESAAKAASILGIQYGTYRKHATRLGVFRKNQAGSGISKPSGERKIPLEEILMGKHPQYQSNKLRRRLLQEGIKEHKCECCGITDWMNKPTPLEVDHIDGNSNNHIIQNIRLLCPNCHAQTETYRGKNK